MRFVDRGPSAPHAIVWEELEFKGGYNAKIRPSTSKATEEARVFVFARFDHLTRGKHDLERADVIYSPALFSCIEGDAACTRFRLASMQCTIIRGVITSNQEPTNTNICRSSSNGNALLLLESLIHTSPSAAWANSDRPFFFINVDGIQLD